MGRDNAIVRARDCIARSDLVVIDTETTGFVKGESGYGSKGFLVQLSVIAVDGSVVGNMLINPDGVPIQKGAQDVHGISQADVEGCLRFKDIYPRVARKLSGKAWLIYNADYDMHVLDDECQRIGEKPMMPLTVYDAMKIYAEYREIKDGRRKSYKWHKLTEACKYMGIDTSGAHNSLSDVRMTLQLMAEVAKQDLSK